MVVGVMMIIVLYIVSLRYQKRDVQVYFNALNAVSVCVLGGRGVIMVRKHSECG